MNKHSIQFEGINNNKIMSIEQSIIEVKDELHVAISQKVNNITERVIVTWDVNNDTELEPFRCDNRGMHPMQFLNRVRECNRFNNNSWEVQLPVLKIIKCFKRSSAIWAEVHKTEWESYKKFERGFREKYWSKEDQEVLRSKITVSYTHLDVYKRQLL